MKQDQKRLFSLKLIDKSKQSETLEWEMLMHNAGFSHFSVSSTDFIYVYTYQDKYIGTVTLDIFKTCGIIKQLVVHSDYRKQGLGRDIVKFSLNLFKQNQLIHSALSCHYWLFNFYKKFGYKVYARKRLPFYLRMYPQFSDKNYMACSIMLLTLKRTRIKKSDSYKILETVTNISI